MGKGSRLQLLVSAGLGVDLPLSSLPASIQGGDASSAPHSCWGYPSGRLKDAISVVFCWMVVSPQFWMVLPFVAICSFAWKLPMRGWNSIGNHLLPALKGRSWLTSAELNFFFILENCIDINNEIRSHLIHISPSSSPTRPSQQPPSQLHVFLFFFFLITY